MDLDELQARLSAAISHGVFPDDLRSLIRPSIALTPHEAIAVYSGGYLARLTEALGETYEAVWWVLGDHDFFELCAQYIKETPSRVRNLSHYGDDFPNYLGGRTDFPFLQDLAWFESMFWRVFHSATHVPTELSLLPKPQDLAESTLHFPASFCLFESKYSVHDIWQLRKGPTQAVEWNLPQRVGLWKHSDSVFVRRFTRAEYFLAEQLSGGRTVGEAVSALSEHESVHSEDEVTSFFQWLFESGILCAPEDCRSASSRQPSPTIALPTFSG